MTDRELMQQALEAMEFYYDQHGEESDAKLITALRERLAQPEQDWDWRHPKAQALIGAKARLEIKLRLVEQLVEDPNLETTASDMEYWEPLHDKLQERLAQPEQEPVAWVYPEGLEALKNGKPWTAYGSNGDGRIPLYLNDAVARRVEPRASGSGAGFESLPASPTWWHEPDAKMNYRKWQGLTADEIWQCNAAPPESAVEYHICMAHQNVMDFAEAIEAKLREKNT